MDPTPPGTPSEPAGQSQPQPRTTPLPEVRGAAFPPDDPANVVAASQALPGLGKLLLLDRRFKWAIGGFVLLLLALVALLPRIWRVTPARISALHVSGLDYLEAKALERRAAAEKASGQAHEAISTYEAALANNPADPTAMRGILESVLATPEPPDILSGRVLRTCFSLIDLCGTNVSDVNLATAALAHVRQDEYATVLGEAREKDLDARAFAALAGATFRLGRVDRFDQLWRERDAELQKDPAAALVRAAWQAGWGPAGTRLEGRRRIEAALAGSDDTLVRSAHRLSLRVALVEQNLGEYERHFAWLKEHHADQVIEHVNLWRLMAMAGRRDDAAALATAFSTPPQSGTELVGLAEWQARLGMPEAAIKRIQGDLGRFGYSVSVWTTLARLQIQLSRWEDLRQTALAIRGEVSLQNRLDGYSLYLTGLSDYRLGRNTSAEEQFRAAVHGGFAEPALAFEAAKQLEEIGFPSIGEELLRKVEGDFGTRAGFWSELANACYRSQDTATLSNAVRKAYALDPSSTDIANRYAAALLALRETPEEAIQVTLRLHLADPGNRALAENHALALLQNGRLDEANDMLKQWNPDTLPGPEAATVLFGTAEYWVKRGDAARAQAAFSRITPTFLMPTQKAWFTNAVAKLDPKKP